jgi:hypothetical protein
MDDRLTRMQVARLVGCSKTQVRNYERRGILRPSVDGKGVHWFLKAEVAALARKKESRADARAARADKRDRLGELAARVFFLFREGVELPEIVIETKRSPELIRRLYDEYRRPLATPPTALEGTRYAQGDSPSDASGELQGQAPSTEPNPPPTAHRSASDVTNGSAAEADQHSITASDVAELVARHKHEPQLVLDALRLFLAGRGPTSSG